MEKYIAIEVEVEEVERGRYLEKLRDLFLKKGFIVEREWEDNIELSRPLSTGKQGEIVMYPWIDKVYVQGKGSGVVVNCSVRNFMWFRYLILYVIPIIDIAFILLLFFFIEERIILIPVVAMMFFSFFFIFFVFKMQFRKMIHLLAEEVQNIDS